MQEAKQVQLDAARELLGQVQLQYDTAAENEAMLAHQLESLRTKSGHCQRMRVALSQSKEKWTARMESIEEQTARLQGDSLLAACCIVYLGLLPEPVRAELVEKWKSVLQHTVRIPYTLDFQLPAFMALRDMSGRYIPRKVRLLHLAPSGGATRGALRPAQFYAVCLLPCMTRGGPACGAGPA